MYTRELVALFYPEERISITLPVYARRCRCRCRCLRLVGARSLNPRRFLLSLIPWDVYATLLGSLRPSWLSPKTGHVTGVSLMRSPRKLFPAPPKLEIENTWIFGGTLEKPQHGKNVSIFVRLSWFVEGVSRFGENAA